MKVSARGGVGGPDLTHLDPLLGDVFVEAEIARTPRAAIYRIRTGSARESSLALKVALQPGTVEELARFQHEARLLSEVRHPNVIEVYDVGVLPGGYPFLTMELLAARNITAAVQTPDWGEFYDLAIQAAAGLAHIHRQGVLHLDIKPNNLGLIDDDGGGMRLKILDFGLAEEANRPLDRRIRGTLAYAAPEILLQDRYDHRADLYSLGLTLYQLATGVLPSEGDELTAIRFHLQEEAPDPRQFRPDMPEDLARVLLRLLQRDPQRRYPSAVKLLVELAAAAGKKIDPGVLSLGRGTVLASRLVGRGDVVDELRHLLAKARTGQGQLVLLEGPEGVGKSRLLREFRLLASVEEATVAFGQGVADRVQPLKPILEALSRLGVNVGVQATVDETAEDGGDRFRLYQEIAAQLVARAEQPHPVAVLLDDVQLAGRETEELLAYIAGEILNHPVLVVASRRPPTQRSEEEDLLGHHDDVRRIDLEPLDRGDTRLLVDACLGTENLPAAFYDWVFDRTGGSPARVQQLLRHLVDQRGLRFRSGEWKPSVPTLRRLAVLLENAEDLDWQRVQRLAREERRALEAAAVIEEPFDLNTLAWLLAEPPEVTYGKLTTLVAAGFLERLPRAASEIYCFVQESLRETVYGEISLARRRKLHGRLAAYLEERWTAGERDLLPAVAEHYWRSGNREKSLPYLLEAAEKASAVYGHPEAAALFHRSAAAARAVRDHHLAVKAAAAEAQAQALAGYYNRSLRLYHQLLRNLSDGRWRRAADRRFKAELWLRKGRLHSRLGEHQMGLECYDAGLEELGELPGPDPLAIELLQAKAAALRDLGQLDEAYGIVRGALRRSSAEGFERQRAGLLNSLGMIRYLRGDWARAGRFIRRGLQLAKQEEADRLVVTLQNNLANVLWKTGDYRGALDTYRENLSFCERTKDLWGQLSALHNLGVLQCSLGRWKEARGPLTQALDLARRLGARKAEALARLNLGEVEELLGHWNRAHRHYERTLKLLRQEVELPERIAALAGMASLLRKRGRIEEAARRAEEALRLAEGTGDQDLVAHCKLQVGLAAKERQDWDLAESHLRETLELTRAAGTLESLCRAHMALAELALERGETERAQTHLQEANDWAERLGDRFCQGVLQALQGELRAAAGDGAGAGQDFAAAVHLLEKLETPYELAQTLYRWGLHGEQPERAIQQLERALGILEDLGAEADASRVREVVNRTRERQRGERPGAGEDPVLYEVIKVINSTLNLEEVLDRTMDLVLERLQGERGMIVLCDPLTRDLEVAVARNLGREDEAEGQKLSESVVRQVIESGKPVLTVDAQTDPRFAHAESIVASHIVSILCVPLAIRDRLAGAIYVDHCSSRRLFGEGDLRFLLAFGDQAAIAIENARLYGELEEARRRLKEENESLRREIMASHHLDSLIGKSRAITELKSMLERVAQSNSTVLIRGESGTGKGLVARIIHTVSPRRKGPFIHFNCAALPETLVESELFGHEKGAFTGAAGRKPGRFELAHQGTIFLDEIGKISRTVQAKLLRVVEEKEFERVGGTKTLRSDVRVIAATNLNLEEAIAQGEFREDLYYRLNIIPIFLPPLRERKEDIPYLVQHFLAKISRDLGLPPRELDRSVLDLFTNHDWPGNVREMEAAIHRALVLSGNEVLTVKDFAWIEDQVLGKGAGAPQVAMGPAILNLAPGGYEAAIEWYDRQLIAAALEQTGGRIRETARLLGIARNTLKAKMKRYSL